MPPSASNQYQHPNTKTNMSNKIPEKMPDHASDRRYGPSRWGFRCLDLSL